MKQYTTYNSTTGEVIAKDRPYPTADGTPPPDLPSDVYLLEQIADPMPSFNPATEKLVENDITYDTVAGTAARSWSVVALTQAEIDERTPAHVVINGIKWKTDEASQAAFSNMTLLIDKAGMADTEMVMIKDALGDTHAITVAQFNADAITYGLHCYTLFHS